MINKFQIQSYYKRRRCMNISNVAHHKITTSWLLLKITYVILFVAAGADKLLRLVTHKYMVVNWEQYVNPRLLELTHLDMSTLITVVGVIEVAIGLLILWPHMTKIAAQLAWLWLLLIVVNLVAMQSYYDIAIRDVVMAVGAYVLSLLTSVVEEHHKD